MHFVFLETSESLDRSLMAPSSFVVELFKALQSIRLLLFLKSTSYTHFPEVICALKTYKRIVSHHFHIDQNAPCLPPPPPQILHNHCLQEKSKTMVMQNFEGGKQGGLRSM